MTKANLTSRLSCIAITVTSTFSGSVLAQSSIDIQRENIVIFSRESDQNLSIAVEKLKKLYAKTEDIKVRDDLIALTIRKGDFKDALSICKQCKIAQFSESELENLAKAARNEKEFSYSLELYSQLRKSYPSNPNGWLGSALVSTELEKYTEARNFLDVYIKKFGSDAGYQDANRYLLNKTESDISKIGRWQKELKQNPENKELALNLYQLAAKYNLLPLQQKLMEDYPSLFNQNDAKWLSHSNAINMSRGQNVSNEQLERVYKQLSELIETSEPSSLLYNQALQDRIVIANKLSQPKLVIQDYQLLQESNPNIPKYVKEEYADALLALNSPFKALEFYQELEQQELTENKKVRSSLIYKLISASSDAGYFTLAQNYLDSIKEEPFINDYTHTHRIVNPNYDKLFFTKVNLSHWRGNNSEAYNYLHERLTNKTPGDPWSMMALSELERSSYHYDNANILADKASIFLTPNDQKNYYILKGNIALDKGDWKQATNIINKLKEDKDYSRSFLERYELLKSARFIGSFSIQNRTSPDEDINKEISQEYYLYTPKTDEGHSAYIHFLEGNAPTIDKNLKQQRIGVGTNINFYPINADIEVGKGIKLNDKYYLSSTLNYNLNQYLQFSLNGNINGSNTPIKAISQGIYTKDLGISTIYTHNEKFQAGLSGNLMKFDDSNLRKSFSAWINLESYRKDRWSISNTLRFDYQRNKDISTANYYNPGYSRNVEFGMDISYLQPMDNALILTHHLKGSTGLYSQSNASNENSWSLSYGHEWRIGKKLGISYEIGRKKNIYDGDAEFNNFGNANLSIYF